MSFFLAADLDEPVRAEVGARIDALRDRVVAKWLRFDKLHVTLRFLGHPSGDALEAMHPVVTEVTQRTTPFELRLRGVGFFVTARAPSVLWLGVAGDLAALGTLESALNPEPDRPTYLPHVTLARAQTAGALERLAPELTDFCSSPFTVNHVTLYESTNLHYRPLFRCDFGQSR